MFPDFHENGIWYYIVGGAVTSLALLLTTPPQSKDDDHDNKGIEKVTETESTVANNESKDLTKTKTKSDNEESTPENIVKRKIEETIARNPTLMKEYRDTLDAILTDERKPASSKPFSIQLLKYFLTILPIVMIIAISVILFELINSAYGLTFLDWWRVIEYIFPREAAVFNSFAGRPNPSELNKNGLHQYHQSGIKHRQS